MNGPSRTRPAPLRVGHGDGADAALDEGSGCGGRAVRSSRTAASAQSPEGLGMSEHAASCRARAPCWKKSGRSSLVAGARPRRRAAREADARGSLRTPVSASRRCAGSARRAPATALRVAHPRRADGPGEPVRVVIEAPATALYLLAGRGRRAPALERRPAPDRPPRRDAARRRAGAAPAGAARRGRTSSPASWCADARAERVELSAHRPLCIAPADGWRTGRPLHARRAGAHAACARWGSSATCRTRRTVAELEGERFDSASRWGGRTDEAGGAPRRTASGRRPATVPPSSTYRVRLPQPGLFSLEARVVGRRAAALVARRPPARERRRAEPGGASAGSHVHDDAARVRRARDPRADSVRRGDRPHPAGRARRRPIPTTSRCSSRWASARATCTPRSRAATMRADRSANPAFMAIAQNFLGARRERQRAAAARRPAQSAAAVPAPARRRCCRRICDASLARAAAAGSRAGLGSPRADEGAERRFTWRPSFETRSVYDDNAFLRRRAARTPTSASG